MAKMRLLHTADWHLGQKFLSMNRDEEQQKALLWLIETIKTEKIDVLVVSGDIFDVNNPPLTAEQIYYNFLVRLLETDCQHVIIIGGNHDLPSRLNAPAGLLKALNVHIIGAATEPISEQIIVLKNKKKEVMGIVAAVPFLRDKDFKISISGESIEQRTQRIKDGIYAHYQAVTQLLTDENGEFFSLIKDTENRPPLITTGHLYAKGASASEEQTKIYIGNLENIEAEQFPTIYDYVALGHIHRPQIVGKKNHVRYSGSLIHLSFSEREDEKIVLVGDFENGKGLVDLQTIKVPVFRKLWTVKGTLEEIDAKLTKINNPDAPLPAWVEVLVEDTKTVLNADATVRAMAKGLHLEILKVRAPQLGLSLGKSVNTENLDELTPEEVFLMKISTNKEEDKEQLLDTFRELMDITHT
jgi:DNA repair protein SbcD/Mre11